jgi:tartrate dehydratase alpha subunit/fumarate hydratase class I-like protein
MAAGFFDSMVALIVRTSTDLPPDVRAAMAMARAQEPAATQSSQALAIIAQNIDLAGEAKALSARTRACRPSRSRRRSAPINS